MAAAKPSLVIAMGAKPAGKMPMGKAPAAEDDKMGDDMDRDAMSAFVDAVKSGNVDAALAAYRDLPSPGGGMSEE